MIYLRLHIEPVFRAPNEVTEHYEADVVLSHHDLDESVRHTIDLLRDQGWEVTAVRGATMSVDEGSFHRRPRLLQLARQARLHRVAYLIRYREGIRNDERVARPPLDPESGPTGNQPASWAERH